MLGPSLGQRSPTRGGLKAQGWSHQAPISVVLSKGLCDNWEQELPECGWGGGSGETFDLKLDPALPQGPLLGLELMLHIQ